MVGGKSKNNHKVDDDAEVLKKALKRFDDSWKYAKANWHDKWDRDQKLYDNERVNAKYEGTSDTFVPMPFALVETLVTAMINANLRFQFKSGDPRKSIDDKPFNALLSEWWDEDQWDLMIEEDSRETFTTGMCGNFVYWDAEARQPRVESYAMRDMILDPTVRRPADLQRRGAYAGRRFFVRKGSLDDIKVIDMDETSKTYGQLIPRYKTVNDDSGDKGEPDDRKLKEMFSGSTLDTASEDQDEIIEIWDVDRVVTIKNRKHVIENVENIYKVRHEQLLVRRYLGDVTEVVDPEALKASVAEAERKAKAEARGIVPIWFMRNYRKLSIFHATSEINAIAKPTEALNDHTNMELDSIIRQVAPQKELDPDYNDWLDLITDEPAVVYPFKPGSLVDRAAAIAPQSFNNRLNLKNEIREATAIDQTAKGVQSSSDQTATEVKAQLSQSGNRIQSKARIFEKDAFYWFGWIIVKMVQLYITEPIVVSVPGGARMTPEEVKAKYKIDIPAGAGVFDPADFTDDVQIRVSLEVDEEGRKADLQKQSTGAYQVLIQDPSNNLDEIKRRLYPKMFDLDQEDLDAILSGNPNQALPMMPGQEATPGAPVPALPPMEGAQGV